VARIGYDANDRPHAYEEVFLPVDRIPGMARDIGVILDVVELAQRHRLSLGRVTEHVRSVRAIGDIALHLGIAETITRSRQGWLTFSTMPAREDGSSSP
jgi:hypothetical protein